MSSIEKRQSYQRNCFENENNRTEFDDPKTALLLIKPQDSIEKTQQIETILTDLMKSQGFMVINRIEKVLTVDEVYAINPQVFGESAIPNDHDEASEKFKRELIDYMTSGTSVALIVKGENARSYSMEQKLEFRRKLSDSVSTLTSYNYADFICNLVHVPEYEEYANNLRIFLGVDMPLSEVYRNPKNDYYSQLVEEVRFTDWDRLSIIKNHLEDIVSNEFTGNDPLMKLIGSSATGTMRKGHEDLDYAVAFQTKIENEDFIEKIHRTELDITEINQNKAHGYVRVCGNFQGYDFVLVPMVNPNGQVQAYEQDAFYQSDFINSHKIDNHANTVILLKEFFEQIGVYKQVMGIGCEMMSLYFRDFDSCINHLANNDSLRINFSQNNDIYTSNPLVIDYPFLGGRSFTDKITPDLYGHIQDSARSIIKDYKMLGLQNK